MMHDRSKQQRPLSPTLPRKGGGSAPGRGQVSAGALHASQINVDPSPKTLDDDDDAFHEYLKTLPKEEAQAQFQARITRQYAQQRRLVNNIFLFWVACEDGACKRVKACAGNPHDCFMRWWRWVPERHKAHYRAYVRALADGGTHDEAQRYATAEVERLADHIARVEAEQDARFDALKAAERAEADPAIATPPAEAVASMQPPSPERPRGPRVRML